MANPLGSRTLELTGKRFGRLVALEKLPSIPGKGHLWRCLCDCGATSTPYATHLVRGISQSRGCRQRDLSRTHGQAGTLLHNRWAGMIGRCTNPRNTMFRNYGGRGITVAPEWRDFATFAAWALTNGYSPELQIDRIDNDGPYSPENCRFVTAKVNMRNRRCSRSYDFFGEQMTVVDAAAKFGVSHQTIYGRLRRGLTPAEAVGHSLSR